MSIAHDILCQHNRPCPYCGTRMRVPESNAQRRKAASGRCLLPDLPTRDHAIPKSRMPAMGVLYACRRCNQDKADRTVIEWHALLASRGDPRAAIVAAWIKANASTRLRSYDGLKARPRPDPIPTPSETTP